LRLINASRLAPLEELLAELKSGVPSSSAGAGAARGAAATTAFAPAPKNGRTWLHGGDSRAAESRNKNAALFLARGASLCYCCECGCSCSGKAKRLRKKLEFLRRAMARQRRRSEISQEQLAEIKAAIQTQQKFLGELVEQSSRWELDGAELRLYFSPEKRPFAEFARRARVAGKIRAISARCSAGQCASVLNWKQWQGRPRRRRSGRPARKSCARSSSANPLVRSMLQRFGGKISEVKRGQEES